MEQSLLVEASRQRNRKDSNANPQAVTRVKPDVASLCAPSHPGEGNGSAERAPWTPNILRVKDPFQELHDRLDSEGVRQGSNSLFWSTPTKASLGGRRKSAGPNESEPMSSVVTPTHDWTGEMRGPNLCSVGEGWNGRGRCHEC